MSVLLITMFMSITILANAIHAVPSHNETIISQMARAIWGEAGGVFRLCPHHCGAFAVLLWPPTRPSPISPVSRPAQQRRLAPAMTYRGRRLVFTWGVLTLSFSSIGLVIVTGAVVTNLIHLYAIGVFLGFTISQAGMTRRFWRAGRLKPGEFTYGLETKITYDRHWKFKLLISGTGAVVTFLVMIVFIVTKFTSGAWFIVILIPTLVWVFFRIHRHYKQTAARLRLEETPTFEHKPVVFDPKEHTELAIYFCDTWSKIAVAVVAAILKRGIPMQIIHVSVDPRRAEAFIKHSQEIVELNQWDAGITQVVEDPYRDLYHSVARILKDLRSRYPDVNFQIYIGALRARFPYNLLHMSTDKFLRDALVELENVSLNIKRVEVDSLPLPPDFKVTFEHLKDHPQQQQEPGYQS
jgi:hypothetical protein